MITFTSSIASIGVEGIVDFRLRDRGTGGRHERQTTLGHIARVQSLREMLKQLFLLRQWERVHGGFDFSKRAHARTMPASAARFKPGFLCEEYWLKYLRKVARLGCDLDRMGMVGGESHAGK